MNQCLTLHTNTEAAFGKDIAQQLDEAHTYMYFT